MLGFLERHRLIKKGLASGKVRRRRSENEFVQALEAAILPKCLIFSAFVAGLAVIIFSSADSQPAKSFLIALLIFFCAIAWLWMSHPQTFAKNSRVLLIFGVFLAHLALLKMTLFLAGKVIHDLQMGEVLLPFAFAPLICSVLLGRNLGLYAAIFASLWGWIIVGGDVDSSDFLYSLFMSLICGFIAVYATLQVRRRSRLIRAGVFVGLATWILAVLFQIIPIEWEQFPSLDWGTISKYSLAAIGSGIFTAMLVGGALPLLESIFEITTDISWLELADLNHPLLKRMTIEAPGTYHHSLVVANLAEAAAEAVGANPTMCRVGAYFHDIGKLVKPEYFMENMNRDHNPHLELAPTMSTLIIIAHVKEGVDLALKYKLNQEIIDVIQQHHGTTLVYFFYKRALQQQEDARQGGKIMNIREEDIPEVRDESFRYPGPRPQSREGGIISLADTIESASRSLEKVTPQKIDQMINDLIQKRIEEHQLDECDLTLRDIKLISDSFKFTLRSMLHSRIAYPGDSSAKEPQKPLQQDAASPLFPRLKAGSSRTFSPFVLIQITFSNRQRNVKLNVAWLARFAEAALTKCLKYPLGRKTVLAGLQNVDVVIVSDRVSAGIHRRFMNVKGPTDVITFDHGEIIISASMAQNHAKKYGKPLDQEIGLYIIHGLLHLNGYKDKTGNEARAMHKLQNQILADCLASPDCCS